MDEFTDISDILHILRENLCVYILLQDDIVKYVGSTGYLHQRIFKHKNEGKIEFNRVLVRYCEGYGEQDNLERQMINELKSEHNIALIYPENRPKRNLSVRPDPKLFSVRSRVTKW